MLKNYPYKILEERSCIHTQAIMLMYKHRIIHIYIYKKKSKHTLTQTYVHKTQMRQGRKKHKYTTVHTICKHIIFIKKIHTQKKQKRFLKKKLLEMWNKTFHCCKHDVNQ
jgi:hypothetical protein